MKKRLFWWSTTVAGCGIVVLAGQLTVPAMAGDKTDGQIGPDVTASRVGLNSSGSGDDFHYYGVSDGIRAFAVASTSCNVGDEPADWIDQPGDARNPVIGANMYRLLDGKFEHIGMSWVKHSFCAVSEPTCGNCQGTGCDTLGVGCADTYWATLNGSQSGIGPRYEINPQGQGPGGVHDDIYPFPQGGTIGGRLQIHDEDIEAGGLNFVEIQYATHDEDLEERFNNASWRAVNLTLTNISGVEPGQDSVHMGEPAIMAWKLHQPEVEIVPFEDVPGEGRFHLGYNVTDNGDGTWSYEYALHNLNSHRAAGSFSVPLPDGANINEIGFHDVDYHSGDGIGGEDIDGTDWPADVTSSSISWATTPFEDDENANSLRWSSLYNFRFVSDAAPVQGDITVGLWRPGAPDSVTVPALVPGGPTICAEDIAGDDNEVNTQDLLELLGNWGTNGPGADLAEPTKIVDTADLLALLSVWGPCE